MLIYHVQVHNMVSKHINSNRYKMEKVHSADIFHNQVQINTKGLLWWNQTSTDFTILTNYYNTTQIFSTASTITVQ
jgi:hypothetical protein